MPTGSRRIRVLMINLVVVLVAILVSLGGAEALLRVYPSLISIRFLSRFHEDLQTPIAASLEFATRRERRLITSEERTDRGPPFYIYHPDRRYRRAIDEADIEVGAVVELQSDSIGFCNPIDKADRATVDVVMVGDSFTICTFVSTADIFTARIENLTGLSIYNLGIGGIALYEYLELLKKFGLAMKPKVVVMNIYEGNDLRDVIKYFDFIENGGNKKIKTRLGGPFAVSYALAYLKAGVELTFKRIKKQDSINFRYSVEVQGTRTPMNVTNSDNDEVKLARRIESGEISFDLFSAPLKEFVALSVEHGFIPVVTRLPSAHTAYRASVRFEDEAVGRAVTGYSQAQGDWLAENANRIGYRFVDTVPAFLVQVKSRPIAFFPANVHFTKDGHSIVADMLSPILQEVVGAR